VQAAVIALAASPRSVPTRPKHRVSDVVRSHSTKYLRSEPTTPLQQRTLEALARCRTPALGGYVDCCDVCDFRRVVYNPCRNRHCPSCEGQAAQEWLADMQARLLPTRHFHVVFTLPGDLRSLAFQNTRRVYDLMLRAAGRALADVGNDPKFLGAQLGAVAVLHTWTREMLYHPHVHCVVTGGGLSPDGSRWKRSHGDKYLAPTRVLAARFRRYVLRGLRRLLGRGELRFAGGCEDLDPAVDSEAFEDLLAAMKRSDWLVYAKAAFQDLGHLLRYLARYTHRVGMSDRRLLTVTQDEVTFATKDSRKTTLSAFQFLGRFLLHVLPHRFVKIRSYGLYANTCRARLDLARAILAPNETPPEIESEREALDDERGLGPCPECFFGQLSREDLIPAPEIPDPWP